MPQTLQVLASTETGKELKAQWQGMRERITELEAALTWYGEQARLCRLVHSGGDAGRQALAADGGKRARAVLDLQN